MTTIAIKDGVLVADGQGNEPNGWRSSAIEKARLINEEWAVGLCGLCGLFEPVFEVLQGALKENQELDELVDLEDMKLKYEPNDLRGLILHASGQVYEIELTDMGDVRAYKISGPCFAVGSGAREAMGAMLAGASAERAVQIACEIDCYTGTPIQVVTPKRKSKTPLKLV